MKKSFLPAVCASVVVSTLVFCTIAMADPKGYGISGGYGVSRDNIDIYRLGVQKKFSSHWFDSRLGVLSGYFELSCNLWEKSGEKTHGVAFSPVFVYSFNAGRARGITPYVEGGIGAAYIDDYTIAGRNLSSNLQFEDRISIGVIIHRIDLKFGYMHYSNASLKSPNDGIDIWLGTVTWRF
jgi:lipid A 3-O-deacylase